MQYLVLYTPHESTPPTPEHMEATSALASEELAAGALLMTGALGRRSSGGLRIRLERGEYSVLENPSGESVLLGASGFSVVQAPSRATLVDRIRRFLETTGEGECEILELAFPAMTSHHAGHRDPMSGVVPYLNVEGASEASDFYRRAFAAKEHVRVPDETGKRILHCQLEINGGPLMLSDCFADRGFAHQPSHSFTMQLVVADGDLWWKRAVDAGCEVVMPFERAFWGDRYGLLRDGFGVQWGINEPPSAG